MATNKPANISSKIWASLGDVETPTDAKMETGWVAEVPKAQVENWVQNRQDAFNAHVNERGIAEWDATTDYIANKSYVQGSNGNIYKSVQNTGPSTVVQNPTTDVSGTYWAMAFSPFVHTHSLASLGLFADASGVITNAPGALSNTVSQLLQSADAAAGRSALGLGTAATRNVQTSTTDTTTGALMTVGAFGLGSEGSAKTRPTDLDSITVAGFYVTASDALNKPISGSGYVWHQDWDGSLSYRRQVFFSSTLRRIFFRVMDAGTWSSWLELYHTGNISTASVAHANTVNNATPTSVGGLKARLDGTTLYLTNDGSNA